MDELTTWLRAQLDEDESGFDDGLGGPCEAKGLHLWPDRARAEVDAKRRILDYFAEDAAVSSLKAQAASREEWYLIAAARNTIKMLAVPYADRDGYRPEWRP